MQEYEVMSRLSWVVFMKLLVDRFTLENQKLREEMYLV